MRGRLTGGLYLVFTNVDVAGEICFLTWVSLTDVDSDEVCHAGELGGHLAKLTKLGHEGRSGAGPEVEDERPALSAGAEERHGLLGGEVVN